MDSVRWRKRGKNVALTRIDEAAFSILLKEAFPGIVFLGSRAFRNLIDIGIDRGMTAEWLDAHGRDSLHEVDDHPVRVFMPSCQWRPLPLIIHGRSLMPNGPCLGFEYRRGAWNWRTYRGAKLAYDPPTLDFGEIGTVYLSDDPENKAFYGKALRLARKVATDRVRRELPHIGHVYGDGRATYLIGHDAYRWCSESPTRMVAGLARPTLDWEFPDVPWYRAVEGVDRGVKEPARRPGNTGWLPRSMS
jgi:hypothetical protein